MERIQNITGKQNILLADCDVKEVQSFADGLSIDAVPFAVKSHISNWKRTGKASEFKRYAKYFGVGFLYFINRRKYHIIAGWQQFYALIFCFFCSVFHVKKCSTVIALNFTYKEKKGIFQKPYRWFMEKCMDSRYLDYLHVPSEEYADMLANTFAFPRERVLATHFGVNDRYEMFSRMPAPEGYEKDGYALAIGRSNRDYDFLIRAWKDIAYPLVIISDTYKGTAEQNNISILRNVAGEESYPWIANCGLMIIPIDDGAICSGDTVLLTAMSVQRKILITAPSTLAQMYVKDGENAVISEKKEAQFKEIVLDMLHAPKWSNLGERARNSFLDHFSRRSMAQKIGRHLNGTSESAE